MLHRLPAIVESRSAASYASSTRSIAASPTAWVATLHPRLIERANHSRVGLGRKRLQAAERPVLAPGLFVRLAHPAALEAAVDDQLDPADAKPFVAVILLRSKRGELSVEVLGRSDAEKRVHPQGEQLATGHFAQDVQHLGRDSRVADAGEPRFVEAAVFGRQVLDCLLAIDLRRRRQRHEVLRAIDELAVQPAILVAADAASVRFRRLLGDFPPDEGGRIQDVLVTSADDDERMVRAHDRIAAIWKPRSFSCPSCQSLLVTIT